MAIDITREEITEEELAAIAADGRCEDCGHLITFHHWDNEWGNVCTSENCDCRFG